MKSAVKITTIGLGIGAITLSVLTYWYIRRKRISKIPKESWQHIGQLKEIALYPIKSSSAVVLEAAECDNFGLKMFSFHDRRLVVVHENNKKIASAGTYPLMLSIRIEIVSSECLSLTAPHMEPLMVNLNDFASHHDGKRFMKDFNGYTLELIEGLPQHHVWISRVILQKWNGLRLYMALEPIVETSWWREISNIRKDTDLMPIMVVQDKSVKELNARLAPKNHVHHQQFRGNFLIKTIDNIQPFDEDKWLWLKIGENEKNSLILRFNSPCLRCVIPNIDVFTCKRNEDFEPLKTLRSYRLRRHPTDPEMGIYFDVYQEGSIICGDQVYVQYK